MRSQKIRPHHQSHERLATLATRPATGYVQVMSTHIQISPRLCTRLLDGTLHPGCAIGTEAPPAISCRRRSHHPANNNIVRRPRLRPHGPQAWNSLPLTQSCKDSAGVQKTVKDTSLRPKLWTVIMTHFSTNLLNVLIIFII